jgi:hypothetical protein
MDNAKLQPRDGIYVPRLCKSNNANDLAIDYLQQGSGRIRARVEARM